jgi:ketosteroid isomerase-like protein
MPHMTRFSACFFALLLSCVGIAQTPALGSAPDPPPASSSSSNQPAVTSTQSPEIDQFQKIENNWSDSINRHDQYALELVLSPLFVDVAASGDITTRNQQLAQVITGEDKTIYLTQRVITVRMLGDIAVANGTYTLHHKVNVAQVDEKGVFTHVFERLRGGWVCVNSQRTALREDNNVKTKKSSNTEMPFHIPLFSKGDKNNP